MNVLRLLDFFKDYLSFVRLKLENSMGEILFRLDFTTKICNFVSIKLVGLCQSIKNHILKSKYPSNASLKTTSFLDPLMSFMFHSSYVLVLSSLPFLPTPFRFLIALSVLSPLPFSQPMKSKGEFIFRFSSFFFSQ